MNAMIPIPLIEPNIHLIFHNTLAVASIIVTSCLIIFLLMNKPLRTVTVTGALASFSVVIFELTHILGVSVENSKLSSLILTGGISVIFICIFNYHCVMVALKKDKLRRKMIYSIYILGTCLALWYIIFPDTFILTSTPKMYFPNYYVPGQLHWLSCVFFQVIIPALFIYELIHAYLKEADDKERNRIKYFAISLILGWSFGGLILPLLTYNIPVDPAYGIFFPVLFCVPFTYAVVNHELMDINIVAKRAFYFGIMVAICAGILIFFNFFNNWVGEMLPGLPIWIVPVISSLFAVTVSIAVWRKVRENDTLKYNFINKTMHEFRTPLTHIKLAAEDLRETELADRQKSSLDYIEQANEKLMELSDLVKEKSVVYKRDED
jgi:hypothetical protein